MTMQDVTALSTFNPHGGPITHSSTWSKPDSPVQPCFSWFFPTLGFVFNSRVTFRVIINSGIRHNTYSRCLEPLSHSVSGNERLSIRLKLLMVPSYLALDMFHSFNSRDTLMIILGIPPRWFSLITFNCCKAAPYLFVSTMEFLKKRRQLHHDDLKQQNEDINVMNQPLREEQPRPRWFIRNS